MRERFRVVPAAYVFLLAAGRILGSDDYGSLAALLGLLAVVLIPAGALQMAVSREISRRGASGDSAGAARLARGALRLSLLATVPLMVIAFALAAPLSHLLHIHSVGLVVLAVSTLATALVFPVAMGVLQGLQRFHAIAVLFVFPWIVRLRVLALAVALFAGLLATVSAESAGAATQVHFKSPSGNINCFVFATQGGVADCFVRTATWPSIPRKPTSCTLDWAPTEVQLVRSHVTLGACRGDVGPRCYTGGDRCTVLAYGRSVTIGAVRCASSTSGITGATFW